MKRRRDFHSGKRWLHFIPILVLTALGISFTQTGVVQAATIDVPCNVTDLVNAINTANANGEADTLNLASPCTYTLTATLDILADGGNLLTIEGNGATISGNNAVQVLNVTGGAILDLNNVTVTNGFISSALTSGGGIFNFGTLTLTNSIVSGNTTDLGGGGIANIGTLTLINSTVSGNTANGVGGGIANAGTLTLTNSTVSGNTANGVGGGIYNGAGGTATLTNSTVSNNTTRDFGGGIYNDISSTLTLTNSTISANTASRGDGIFNDGALALTNSTVSENSGTGIYNERALTLTNSTIANNGESGIRHFVNLALTLTNSTVANNGVYGIAIEGGSVNLTNTILANNNFADCGSAGTITPSGGNLVEDGSCSIAGALSGDPMLGGLTGSPAYLPLLPGSPAIDAGDNGLCTAADQRGVARPFDGDGNGTATCDLGSYELDAITPPVTPTPTSPYTATPTLTAPVATVPPPPDTPRCEDLNFVVDGVVRASVSDALDYAVYCRVLYANGAPMQWLGGDLYDAGSIGHQGVLDLGVVQAVDVYSPVGMTTFDGGGVICLHGQGTMIFLAARNAPRVPEVVGSYEVEDFPGFTCASLFEPGTLVLVRNTPQ